MSTCTCRVRQLDQSAETLTRFFCRISSRGPLNPRAPITYRQSGRSSGFRITPKLHLPANFAVVFRNLSPRLQRRDRDGIAPFFPILRTATSRPAPVSHAVRVVGGESRFVNGLNFQFQWRRARGDEILAEIFWEAAVVRRLEAYATLTDRSQAGSPRYGGGGNLV
jgi:hypothetical protein